MTPEERRANFLRARVGILMMADVCLVFETSEDTIRRRVKEGNFPQPMSTFRHPVWTDAQIKTYMDRRQEQEQRAADQERARLDIKVHDLYGGAPHGRRP